jgi:Tol biopolymer transport system component
MKFLRKSLFYMFVSFLLLPMVDRFALQASARTLYPYIGKMSPSPDGRYIVFEANFDGFIKSDKIQLYLLDLSTKQVYQLAEPNVEGIAPAWSPDGSVIAFYWPNEDTGEAIYLINPDGTNLRRLTNEPAYYPVWSPDGRYMAVSVYREGDFESRDDILIIDNEGKDVAWLITSPDDDWPVAWSPDGSYILFIRNEEGRHPSLWRANVDLTKPFPAESSGIFRLTEPSSDVCSVAISPNGSHIAITFIDGTGLWIMNADGSGKTLIFPCSDKFDITHIAWCPGINKIAFVGCEFQEYNDTEGYLGPYNIYLINPDGTGLEQITFFTGVEDSQAKAPHFPLFAKVWKNAKKEIAKNKATKTFFARKDYLGKGDKVRSEKMQNPEVAERMNNLAPNSPEDKAPNKSPSLPIFAGTLSLSALSYALWKLLRILA